MGPENLPYEIYEPSSNDIRDFTNNTLGLSMEELFNISKDISLLRDPKYTNVVSILGEMGLRELVDTAKKDERHEDHSIFPEILERLENGSLGTNKHDEPHMTSFAKQEATKLWNSYYHTVFKEKYHETFDLMDRRRLTKEDLLPET